MNSKVNSRTAAQAPAFLCFLLSRLCCFPPRSGWARSTYAQVPYLRQIQTANQAHQTALATAATPLEACSIPTAHSILRAVSVAASMREASG